MSIQMKWIPTKIMDKFEGRDLHLGNVAIAAVYKNGYKSLPYCGFINLPMDITIKEKMEGNTQEEVEKKVEEAVRNWIKETGLE